MMPRERTERLGQEYIVKQLTGPESHLKSVGIVKTQLIEAEILFQRGTADGNDQVNMGKHQAIHTKQSKQSGIRNFTTDGEIKRYQESTLGGKRMPSSKISPLFFAHPK